MRITLNSEDAALSALKSYAGKRGLSLGQAASALIRRGLESLPVFKTRNVFALLERNPGSAPITTEMVESAENEDDQAEYRLAIPPRR